jgi:hypothetical protein
MRDPAIKPANLARWLSCLNVVRTARFPTAGHFVQEKQPAAVREFLAGQYNSDYLRQPQPLVAATATGEPFARGIT